MILVISGGRQIFFASLFVSGREKRGSKKNKRKNVFFDKNDPNLADCKIFAFYFFLIFVPKK